MLSSAWTTLPWRRCRRRRRTGRAALLQGNRVRRGGARCCPAWPCEADAQGADQPAGVAQGIERVTQEPGDAGFAIGAGDADHLQAAAGLAEVAGRQHADLPAQPGHGDARGTVVLMHGEGVAPFHHHGGAGTDRRVDELAAVHVVAGHRQEQIAGGHRAAVQAQFVDGQVAPPFRQAAGRGSRCRSAIMWHPPRPDCRRSDRRSCPVRRHVQGYAAQPPTMAENSPARPPGRRNRGFRRAGRRSPRRRPASRVGGRGDMPANRPDVAAVVGAVGGHLMHGAGFAGHLVTGPPARGWRCPRR